MSCTLFDNIYQVILNLDNDVIDDNLWESLGKQLVHLSITVEEESLLRPIERLLQDGTFQREQLKNLYMTCLDNVYSYGLKSDLLWDYKHSDSIDSFYSCVMRS